MVDGHRGAHRVQWVAVRRGALRRGRDRDAGGTSGDRVKIDQGVPNASTRPHDRGRHPRPRPRQGPHGPPRPNLPAMAPPGATSLCTNAGSSCVGQDSNPMDDNPARPGIGRRRRDEHPRPHTSSPVQVAPAHHPRRHLADGPTGRVNGNPERPDPDPFLPSGSAIRGDQIAPAQPTMFHVERCGG